MLTGLCDLQIDSFSGALETPIANRGLPFHDLFKDLTQGNVFMAREASSFRTFDMSGKCCSSAWRPVRCLVVIWFGFMILLGSLVGCRSFGLPAIDPSGERIFLPSPYRTQLNPDISPGTGRLTPQPAFPTPPAPAPCLDAPGQQSRGPVGTGALCQHERGETGQLLLTPTRIVAPVGGEVILLAGICGTDGYFITKQPIEWMLTPESVGTFIEVGDDSKGQLLSALHAKPKVEKLGVNFAKGRTSSIETVITRGSMNPRDDLPLRKGQTYISLSSPVEGVSRVTALAPESEIWDKRRQTAVIYWLDAQWAFPEPVVADAGATVTLTTTVTSSRDPAVAAENWLVNYRILNPEVARFLPSGAEVAEVRVGRDSKASIQIQQLTGQAGTAIVEVEVVRAAQASDGMPSLPLGKGQTSVTWSTAELLLQAAGPGSARPGEAVTYSVQLGNIGDVQASNVVLQANLPVTANIMDIVPPPNLRTDQMVQWNIGTIPPRQQFVANLNLQLNGPGAPVLTFLAIGSSGAQTTQTLRAERSIRTEIIQPSLRIRMYPEFDATTVEVGRTVRFLIDVENTGNRALEQVVLDLNSASGLQEVESGRNSITKAIGPIGPGQRASVGVVFQATRAGDLCAELKALYGMDRSQNVIAQTSACIQAVTPTPKVPGVTIRVVPRDGRTTIPANGRFVVSAIVENTGEIVLRNLQISLRIGPELTVTSAPGGAFVGSQRQVVWNIPALQPRFGNTAGQSVTVEAELQADRFTAQTVVEASVVSEEQAVGNDRLNLTIDAGGSVLPPDASPADGQPGPAIRAGDWNLQIQPLTNPARVGEDARFTITVRNDQNLFDRNLILELRVSDEAEISSISVIGTNLGKSYTDARRVRFDPIREVRPGETVTWNLTVRPRLPGKVTVEAAIASEQKPTVQSRRSQIDALAN